LLIYKEIQSGAVANSYMRKGFLIYDKIRKYFPIYEEAVRHICLCNCFILNLPIYEENLIFFFYTVYLTLQEPCDGVEPRRFVGQVERVVTQRLGGAGGGGTQTGAREAGPVRGQGCHEIDVSVHNISGQNPIRHPKIRIIQVLYVS
jgi:hypothetical protein